jgi:hypothetical protein
MNDNANITFAMSCLLESIRAILAANLNEANRAEEIAASLRECEEYLQTNGLIERTEKREHEHRQFAQEIAKAGDRRSSIEHLAHRVTDHMLDRLSGARQRYGLGKKEVTMEDIETAKVARLEKLLTLGKNGDAVSVAKIMIADDDPHGLDENTYTAIVIEHCKRLARPGESPEQAFSRVITANDADGLALRKGLEIAKAATFAGSVAAETVGGGEDAEVVAKRAAYEELLEIGRKQWPQLSEAQAFVKASEARPDLLVKAHQTPTASATTYPYPH